MAEDPMRSRANEQKNQTFCGPNTSKMSTIKRTTRAAPSRGWSGRKLPQLLFAVIPILIISILPQASKQQQQQSYSSRHQAPVITPFFFRQNVQENQRSSIVCSVSDGDLPLEFSWLKDGQPLTPPLAQAKKINIKHEAEQSTLQIVPVRFDHAGNYTCVAKNKAGAQAHSTLLTVHGTSDSQQPQQSSPRRLSKRHDAEMILDESGRPHHEPLMLDNSPMDLLESEAESRARDNQNQRGKRTLYACEEKQLQIECQAGESIHLIRANYGRFSIQKCNEHGQLDWKVDCMSTAASFQIIANSCQAKQSCQLLASNSIFGDSCPGTQKYLEVHYQCVANELAQAANRTQAGGASSSSRSQQQATTAAQLRPPNRPNVIMSPQQDSSFSGATTSISTITTSETRQQMAANTMQPPMLRWPEAARPSLPSWMGEVPLISPQPAAFGPAPQSVAGQQAPAPNGSHCPETVWRQIRWPASEANSLVQMPCPAHAVASSPPAPFAASLACLAGGQWAARVQAARCQSVWLRNLTKSSDDGDSPLSTLAELAQRTRTPGGFYGQPAGSASQVGSLFGDDLVQIGRIVRRLVDGMGEILTNGIQDDKQRSGFAREILQSLVELINNLANEQHLDAWLDLAPAAGERQRLASQLLQSLEEAAALLAYHQQPAGSSPGADYEFLKVTDNVYVTIKAIGQQQQQQQTGNRTLEVSFPSEASLLATKWMNNEQRFTLHLQTAEQPAQVDVKYPAANDEQAATFAPGSQSPLKIVFVMLRALGAQMEPTALGQPTENGAGRVLVNSNLVSLSMVPNSRYKFAPLKVHLSAPIELIFRHLEPSGAQTRRPSGNNGPRCVYWDTTLSDWLSDGCKLIATNRTHSSCACDHLAPSFGLLGEFVDQSALFDGGAQNQLHRNEQAKVQLDSVENEIFLANKMLYLAKLLDGILFGAEYQQQQPPQSGASSGSGNTPARLIIYISCLFSAALLGLQLAAAAYSRAHARRLLGAIPAQPPPPLLVSGGRPLPVQPASSSVNSDSSPTYSSDYSAALAATKNKLEAEASYDSRLTSASSMKLHGGCQLRLPIRLVGQLLALQLTLVLLVESQNYLSAQRRSLRQLPPIGPLEPVEPMEPIGTVTWLLVGALYYLVAATTCWLMAQLLRLNLELLPAAHDDKDGAGHYAPNSSHPGQLIGAGRHHQVSGSMFGRQVSGSNLYGAPGAYLAGQQQQPATLTANTLANLHSASSPSSSYSSAADTQHAALSRLEDSARLYGATAPGSAAHRQHGAGSGRRRLVAAVEHALPVLLVALVGWLSANNGRSLNSFAFTSSLWAQVAHWPLLVEATLAPFSLLLYCGPALCLLLLISALLQLRRAHQSPKGSHFDHSRAGISHKQSAANLANPYGGSHLTTAIDARGQHQLAANHFLSGADQHQAALSKQSNPSDNKANHNRPSVDSKGAKFLCSILFGLLALHSISWISFFGHISRALNSQNSNYHLVYAFAASNLALVLLLCWSQRRTFRRAAQLAGLARLAGRWCLCSGGASSAHRFYRNHQQPAGKSSNPSGSSASSGIKVSPSGQSLFIVSQAAQQQQQQQYGASYHYGAGVYSSGQQLYQQHIYESATQLNEQQQRLNMMQLIQQQQQLHQMHQLDAGQHQQHNQMSLNRSLSSLQHLNGRQHQYNGLEQQQQQLARQHLTMGPATGLMHPLLPGQRHSSGEHQAGDSSGQLLVLEPSSHLKQQFVCANQQTSGQQQQSRQPMQGEADGPLVAFSSSSSASSQPPTTFGPSTSLALSAAQSQNPGLCSTIQRQQQRKPTEHQLFSGGQQDQHQSSSPINCISDQFQCQPERNSTSVADANQHQYYSINNNANKPHAANYADALKLAMIQQHQQQNESSVSHHFRRTSSRQATAASPERRHQLAMIDRASCVGGASGNIYDVANFALGQ